MTTLNSRQPTSAPFQAREVLRFLVALILVLLPFLGCFGFIEAVAWRVGETWSMQHIAEWQGVNPDRMWRGGDGRSYLTYKVARIRELRPDIVMLGQSRANFIVASMFKPYSFYNSVLTAWTFDQYLRFLQIVTADGYAPKVLFFNFDYWMFNAEFDRAWNDRFYEQPATHWEDIKIIVDELLKEPRVFLPRMLYAKNVKGIYAVRNGDGFRIDGSLDATWVPDSNPARLINDGINVGSTPAVLGDQFEQQQLTEFERFVAFAESKNIALIGVQFPFYAKILDGLDNSPRDRLWRQFHSDIGRTFIESKGVIFFDYADMPEYRSRPEAFVDSAHPAPKVVQDVMQHVLTDPRVRVLLPELGNAS